jgi:hypothetical protein
MARFAKTIVRTRKRPRAAARDRGKFVLLQATIALPNSSGGQTATIGPEALPADFFRSLLASVHP